MLDEDHENSKHQKPNPKWFDKLTTLSQVEGQIPMTHPPSAGQTNDPSTVVLNGIITGRPRFAKRCDTTAVIVLVIEYCNLRFICNLALEIWDFNTLVSFSIKLAAPGPSAGLIPDT